jgi:hypothetical protein
MKWLVHADETVSKPTIGVSATPFAETGDFVVLIASMHCKKKTAGNGVPAARGLRF